MATGVVKAENAPQESTEYLEHLRTVHFALMTVSAVLILAVTGAVGVDFSRALTEAIEIVEMTDRWPEVQKRAYESVATPNDSVKLDLRGKFPWVGTGLMFESAEVVSVYGPWKDPEQVTHHAPLTLGCQFLLGNNKHDSQCRQL